MPAHDYTPRGRALHWLTMHRGITEQPAGSNRDNRQDGITAAQRLVADGDNWLTGLAWCGVWACAAAMHAGLRIPKPYRWASVANIEDDARNATNGFTGWAANPAYAQRGDLVVLFGRGIHVETVRVNHRRLRILVTDGGNTSRQGDLNGSQSNGGGAFKRWRTYSTVHGIAHTAY